MKRLQLENIKIKEAVLVSVPFNDCVTEKTCTLIRYDILEVFRKIYDSVRTKSSRTGTLSLIQTEEDPKYRKKYTGLWKEFALKKKRRGRVSDLSAL
jgi:hypothetical protein